MLIEVSYSNLVSCNIKCILVDTGDDSYEMHHNVSNMYSVAINCQYGTEKSLQICRARSDTCPCTNDEHLGVVCDKGTHSVCLHLMFQRSCPCSMY